MEWGAGAARASRGPGARESRGQGDAGMLGASPAAEGRKCADEKVSDTALKAENSEMHED